MFFAITECLASQISVDGLGPCKRATRANFGSIVLRFSSSNQVAVIGIMANAPKSTKVKLICTSLVGVTMFTVSLFLAYVVILNGWTFCVNEIFFCIRSQ